MAEGKGENRRLSHDLIIEILLRLPPKDLCKFRCVSKFWRDFLIFDKEFIERYIEFHKKKPLLLITKYVSEENGGVSKTKAIVEITSIDMEGNAKDRFKTIIEGIVHTFISCGPLAIICCMCSLYVCNPSFREVIPVLYYSRTRSGIVGFGYLPSLGKYKIVHMFEEYVSRIGTNRGCEVLTFRNVEDINYGYWKRITGVCPHSVSTEKNSLCVDGSVFWSRSSGGTDKSILRFDLEKEELSVIKYPDHDHGKYSFMEFTEVKGSLCVIGCFVEKKTMDVWMFNRSENVWIMDHCISLFPYIVNFLVSSDYEKDEILTLLQEPDIEKDSIFRRCEEQQ